MRGWPSCIGRFLERDACYTYCLVRQLICHWYTNISLTWWIRIKRKQLMCLNSMCLNYFVSLKTSYWANLSFLCTEAPRDPHNLPPKPLVPQTNGAYNIIHCTCYYCAELTRRASVQWIASIAEAWRPYQLAMSHSFCGRRLIIICFLILQLSHTRCTRTSTVINITSNHKKVSA